MTDLPEQSVLQQQHARPVPAEQLEMLGKRAAVCWHDGVHCSLTCAVTDTVKSASVPLSPEQVRRVVEFANTEAYLIEFKKEGAHKIVDFGPCGPANPADVLRDLNDGGGKTVMDSGLGDYRRPPEKRASYEHADETLAEAFLAKSASVGYPEENPLGDVVALRDKVAGAYDHITSQISGLEVAYMDLSNELYGQVKQAALNGTSLGEIIQAWTSVSEDPAFVKAAFDQFVPRLFNEGVFSTLEQMGNSITKTAGVRQANPDHPLVQSYNDFCETLNKLASLREEQEELYRGYNQLSGFISEMVKSAAKGPIGKGMDWGEQALKKYLKMGPTSSYLVSRGVPLAAGAAALKGAHDYLEDTGTLGYVPGTQAYDYRRAVLQSQRQQQRGW